ncbi:uncharacterized protein LOC135710194 [Ochlerotatus camptorhynchus]|uniref:uncharacterized protein LOC135710194 n=1 Tax=Ochlerotatus camptorhynchus TaxID=644619 RepID=UPI0031E134B7
MAEHLLQRFANMGSSSTVRPPATAVTLSSRIHHEPFVKYPVFGPGSGPEIYEEGEAFWAGETFPGFFPGPAPPLPPPPPPPPAPYRVPYGKYGTARFKGASVAILTFIGFLFFLSVLQNYIRDYSATSSPTVIVLSSGATKENLAPQYPFLQKNDAHLSEEVDAYSYKKTSNHGSKKHKNQKRQYSSDAVSTQPALFSDLLTIDGMKKKKKK